MPQCPLPLPANRAFVVQLRAQPLGVPWSWDGRVEQVVSGQRLYRFFAGLLLCWLLMLAPAWSVAQPKQAKAPPIEPQAAHVLKHMTEYLTGLQQFSVQAEIAEDVLLDSGLTIQAGRRVTASVRRPNRLRVDALGDLGDRQLVYDGKTMTLMDLSNHVYSTIDVPPEIDAALNPTIKAYNLRAPLADLIYANTYDYLMAGTLAGFYLGLNSVDGCWSSPAPLWSPGLPAWATSLGARGGVGTSAGAGAPPRGAAGTPVATPRGYVR
jgi:Predicted periplasmic protein (DUF2092)